MNRIYVALDLETTGLDPERDAIMEIGAVRFRTSLDYGSIQAKVLDTWSTLVNPGRPIPIQVQQLTGIRQDEVDHAPRFSQILNDLRRFVGGYAVVGHNVQFDLRFLRTHGLSLSNPALDTFELAGILAPHSDRYSLTRLGQDFGLSDRCHHRALDDALAAKDLFVALMGHAAELPRAILQEIGRLAAKVDWPLKEIFRVVEQSQARTAFSGAIGQQLAAQLRTAEDVLRPLFATEGEDEEELVPAARPRAVDVEGLAAMLEEGGQVARHLPGFEHRPQQVEMLRAVARALNEQQHLLVEAGTGTGKSLAYLLPAIAFAHQNGERVVVSTNTINLQDQLINKDIPDLRAALGLNLRAAVLKGRSNYLCPRRLEGMRRRGPQNADEMRVLGKILIWLQQTETGDRAEINLNGPVEREIWNRLSAEDETCTAENCLRRTGGACPFYRARMAAQAAHLLIVNHALLLADVATGNKVLPDYDYLIVDEAHHLEEATTNALSFRVTQFDVERLLRELGGPNAGLLGWTLKATQSILPPDQHAALGQVIEQITNLAFRLENLVRGFFISIERFMSEQREAHTAGLYAHQERILPSTRTQPAWGDVELAWDETEHTLQPLLQLLGELCRTLGDLVEVLDEEDEELYSSFTTLYRRLVEVDAHLKALVFEPEPDRIYWAEIQPNGYRVALHAAPLHIGPLMDHYLWREKQSVILTSATLTTGGEFDYLRGRLNAVDAYELALGSPFDYERSALLYMINDIPEPSDRTGHQRAVEQGLIQLCRATGGRTLVLFTSYEQLKRTSQAIAPALARDDILVYEQGEGASPHTLLETFRSSERAVLLGTRAFWEGVDVPGQALSVLVIVKLPFDVPTDPIIAARAETFEDPFYQYSLPEAILRFRQGFGRLIRTQFDHGVIAIFDKRILTKRYGRAFIDSLPTCAIRTGPLANLPQAAARWLNL